MRTIAMNKKIALIFPGQGAQKQGMFQELYLESAIVRDTFHEANDILGYDLFKVTQQSKEFISKLENSTPLIFTGAIAFCRYLQENYDLLPTIMVGHSLGEYSALTFAGGFTFQEGLEMVMYRAKLAQIIKEESGTCMMVVVGVNFDLVENVCRKMRMREHNVYISCYNADKQTCICGTKNDLKAVEKYMGELNGRCHYLENNAPYHTPFMRPAKEKLQDYLKNIELKPLQYPVLSSMNCKEFSSSKMLVEQLTEPVQWVGAMQHLQSIKCDWYVECGCNSILQRLLQRTSKESNVAGYDSIEKIKTIFTKNR